MKIISTALFAFLCHSMASAAELVDLSLEELMDVEVTLVSRAPQRLTETAAAVFVITGDELRRSGLNSIPEALRLVPGLQVGVIDANKWIVTSRGFAGLFSNKLLVLIDGRSVYTPLFSGVFWESQDVFLEDVERIEVIRGPGGTLWGANAVNGIINVVTRNAVETRGTMLQLGAGMEERSTANVRHGGVSADGRLAYRVWGKAFQRDDSAPAGALAVDDSWHMLRSGFRVDYRMSETDALMVSADANAGDVGQSLTYTRSPPPPIRETVYDRPDVSGANLLSRWTHQFAGGSELDAQLYLDHFHRVESVLQGDINNVDLDIQHVSVPMCTKSSGDRD